MERYLVSVDQKISSKHAVSNKERCNGVWSASEINKIFVILSVGEKPYS